MADYDENVYHHPEKHGLTVVGEVDTAGGYEFNMLVVWVRDEDSAMFWSTDSGCSCPSPFEDVEGVDGLTPVTDVSQFSSEARKWFRDQSYVYGDGRDALERLIRKVQRRARKAATA
ncbi:hypothetical protein J3S85_37795 [Streptomyces lavenduligriseus]|nr:hypothetical protein J3S85_37795 [Streptomyces lavenduligriseus]